MRAYASLYSYIDYVFIKRRAVLYFSFLNVLLKIINFIVAYIYIYIYAKRQSQLKKYIYYKNSAKNCFILCKKYIQKYKNNGMIILKFYAYIYSLTHI